MTETTKAKTVQAFIMIPALLCLLPAVAGLIGVVATGTVRGTWGIIGVYSVVSGMFFTCVAGFVRCAIEGKER